MPALRFAAQITKVSPSLALVDRDRHRRRLDGIGGGHHPLKSYGVNLSIWVAAQRCFDQNGGKWIDRINRDAHGMALIEEKGSPILDGRSPYK